MLKGIIIVFQYNMRICAELTIGLHNQVLRLDVPVNDILLVEVLEA